MLLIKTVGDFRRAIRSGPYAWPGGYPVYFLMADGEPMSFKAAKDNRRQILDAICDASARDWKPVALEINWENKDLVCAHTGQPIESAYGED